ncbi:NADPH-dependent FMN reductase [Epidermidibacterium keratini]|uniref:NADPH-dependent FMN reductase n=1 Tax=Epidermidibacterium keratini TaxID=1891644 RepID=A0A7L4YP71_9ACTN|nr:FMN reductase [Epidermidibacterium keratini]QHC01075.1 NADPH-dependent FMN reductase [Epidermidibacterium keratini]
MKNVVVLSAGLRSPSSTRMLADRMGAAARTAIEAHGDTAEISVFELRDYAHDITNAMLSGFAAPALQEVIDQVIAADALVVVTPTFSASYSGLFKSFFDIIEPDLLAGKIVQIAATGGTERHSLALEFAIRPLFAYLKAQTLPTAVYAATSDWGNDTALQSRIDRAARELADAVAGRAASLPPDPADEIVPFEQLLAR